MRDSALNLYRFPGNAYVQARGSIEIRYTNGANNPPPGSTTPGADNWFDNLPADNPHFVGDSVYLMDNAGPVRDRQHACLVPLPLQPR